MEVTDKYKSNTKKAAPSLESIAEAWVRLCLFHIQHKKKLVDQYQDKKYAYRTA